MNKINPSIPPPPPSSPTSIDQLHSPPIQRGKERKSLHEVTSLPFPESLVPDPLKKDIGKSGSASSIQAPINDALLEELDQTLHSQSDQIEKKFKEIEEREQGKELIDAILKLESWGYDILSFTGENLPEGVNFLEKVLPVLKIDEFPFPVPPETLGNFSSLFTTFLTCIDAGAQGAALICKVRILEKSKQLLEEFKSHLTDPSSFQSIEGEFQENSTHMTSKKHFQKMIDEWELQINLEEKELAQEKMHYGLNTSGNILTILSEPLTYLPKTFILEHLHITKALGWITLGTEYAGLALELKQIRRDSHTFNQWKESYQKWQAVNLPKFIMTERGAERIELPPLKQSVHLSAEQHKNILFKIIQNKNLSFVWNKLNECGIKIPSTIATKDDLIGYLRAHPELMNIYVEFQQKIEALNTVIYTSESLLAKRQATMAKKTLFLKHRFHIIQPQIHQRKKELFHQGLQSIMQQLLNPNSSLSAIENQFMQWGFFQSPLSLMNQKLLLAFKMFKHDQLQNNEALSISKQHFITLLREWMEHPDALEKHFEKWFHLQNQDQLMREYIDHQETIELTIKNSIKQMVEKKHALEKHTLNFKSNKSHMHFGMATLTLGLTGAFTLIGLVGTSIAGAGAILLALSIGTATLSFGFLTAGYLHNLRYKPHTAEAMSFLFQIKTTWTNLQNSIAIYSHQSKEKKLIEVAKILYQLHVSSDAICGADKSTNHEYQKALAKYQKAKLDFEMSQEKVNYWTQKLKKIESRIKAAEWKDFSQYSSLPIGENTSFDTLNAFQNALQACDLRLLDAETKHLLEIQLGINLDALQTQIKQHPEEMKNTFQDFFALTDTGLVDFIRKQQGRLKKGLITL